MECHSIDNPGKFALAGNATFTLVSQKTGSRFTYRVRAAESGPLHFVSVLTGPDNMRDYSYFGFLRRGVFFHGGQKAKVGQDAPSSKAFAWFWMHTMRGDLSGVDVMHEGKCCRCGRALTVPESIRAGIGPECAGKI